jgi:valyl-tRNA synthetase
MDARYDQGQQEKKMQQRWEESGLYRFNSESDREVFSVDTPPPTVSGSLHIGHIFSYTHQDIIARFKRQRGYSVFYPMGYDDNGLPTERFVEKKHGIKGHKMARSEFIKLCLQETHDVEKMFEQLWKSMGFSIDWSQTYSTISSRAQRVAQQSFVRLFHDKKVYRKAEPSLYCTTCRTSVAQAELESVDLPSNFYTIIFKDQEGNSLSVATTRPELLPACVAVLYHPDDARFTHLKGQKIKTPVFNGDVPAIADESVLMDKGTGLVMCCTFGDQLDIEWVNRHQLSVKQIINRDGTWQESAGPLAGLTVQEARKKVIALLQEQNLLIDQKSLVHAVNTHERCKQPIEYLNLSQWFVRILDYKKEFLALGDQINWYPAFMQSRYNDWVENLSWDWGISRQRFYGIPFPVWHCNACSEILIAPEDQLPIDPQEKKIFESCTTCQSTDVIADTDVMDTWNTSSLTPQILTDWPNKSPISLPLSMRPQAHDIIRTWAFDTIVKAYFHHQTIPWKNIVISGHVRAGKEKISKSKENSKVDPINLLQEFSADAIRYWTAHGRLGTDTAFSEMQLKSGQRLVTKLWNAFLFIKPHVTATGVRPTVEKVVDPLNRWLLHHARILLKQYIKDFDQYEYTSALEATETFFWQLFCDQFLEIVKDQFNNPGLYAESVLQETRFVLYEVGLLLLQLYAPFVPHIVDAIFVQWYAAYEKNISVHAMIFDEYRLPDDADAAQADLLVEHVLKIIGHVRRLKSEAHISLKTPLYELVVRGDEGIAQALEATLLPHLKGVTRAQAVVWRSRLEGDTMHLEGENETLKAFVLL